MFDQQRILILQPTSTPSAPPPDDLTITCTFPYKKAVVGPTPVSALSWKTHPDSKTVMSRLDYETIARTQDAQKEPSPKGSWSHRSNSRSEESSWMKLLQRAASTASSSSSGGLRKLGIATWPYKWTRKATTKITISTVLTELPPRGQGSPTWTLSSIADDPDPHDISAQYFGSSSADQSANEESEPGAAVDRNTIPEDSSNSEAGVAPVNSDPHDSKRVEQQRLLAYYRLTGGERQENKGAMDGLRADDFKQGAQAIWTEEEKPQPGALVMRREGHLSIISERRSEYDPAVGHLYNTSVYPRNQPAAENDASSEDDAFSKFLRTCLPPPIPNKSPSRRLRDFGARERDRVDGSASTSLPSNQKQIIPPSEEANAEEDDHSLSLSSHEPEVISPTPLSPALPHFHTVEEAEAYRRSQDSKHPWAPPSYAVAKCDDDSHYGNEASQTESAKYIHFNTDHGSSYSSQPALKLPDISRNSISKYSASASASTSNALASARSSSTSLSPTERARLRPEPLNLISFARGSTPRSSLYAPLAPPSLPLTPPQSKDGDCDGSVTALNANEASKHDTSSPNGDSVQLQFKNPGPSTITDIGTDTDTDRDPSLAKIGSCRSSSHSSKKSIHEETGPRDRTTPNRPSSAEKKSQSMAQSPDPDVKERRDWYSREVRLRVEKIRRALRTTSFYSGGSV